MLKPLLSVSTLALVVAASPVALPAAWAADLGGNCCADLEERVAELEATTARKGNRKVSLTIYGQITEQLMFWDDGREKNAYVSENAGAKNIIGFRGSAKISSDWSAGFKLEYQAKASSSDDLNQFASGDHGGTTSSALNTRSMSMRHGYWYLNSATLGTVSVGQQNGATSEIVNIDLGGIGVASLPDAWLYNGGFRLRNSNGSLTGTPGALASDGVGIVGINWRQLMTGSSDISTQEGWDTYRRNLVKYQSPSLAGFYATASWGEDDFWDASLRYAGEFAGFRIAAGIGYREDRDFPLPALTPAACAASGGNCDSKQSAWIGSGSIMHVQTGLFLTGAGGEQTWRNLAFIGSSDNREVKSDFWYLAGGISNNFFGLGNTVLYGEYSNHNDGLRQQFTDVTSSNVKVWGLGLIQNIDAAAMELYVSYKNYQGEFDRNNGTLAAPVMGHVTFQDFQIVMTGARIRF